MLITFELQLYESIESSLRDVIVSSLDRDTQVRVQLTSAAVNTLLYTHAVFTHVLSFRGPISFSQEKRFTTLNYVKFKGNL